MTREDYLTEHHYLCESMIGLISIQENIDGVKKVLDTWKPKLKEIRKQRYLTLCEGMSEEEIKNLWMITGLKDE